MSGSEFSWKDHFTETLFSDKKRKQYICLYCGLPFNDDKELLIQHLSTCPLYIQSKRRRTKKTCSFKERTEFDDPILDSKELTFTNQKLCFGIVFDTTSIDLLHYYITTAERTYKFHLSSVCCLDGSYNSRKFSKEFAIQPSCVFSKFDDLCQHELTKRTISSCFNLLVLSSHTTHFSILYKAIDCGFNILCSSPLCLTEVEAIHIFQKVQTKGVQFHSINTICSTGMIQIAKQLIQSYTLGEILNIEINSFSNQSFHPGDDSNVYFDRGVSNCTATLGIPAYETLEFLINKPVYRLLACLQTINKSNELDDAAYITIELEGGAYTIMTLSSASALHVNDFSIRIIGSYGCLEWSNNQPTILQIHLQDEETQFLTPQTEVFHNIHIKQFFSTLDATQDSLYIIFNSFYNSIMNHETSTNFKIIPITCREAMESILFLSACITSNQHTNSWVEMMLPPT